MQAGLFFDEPLVKRKDARLRPLPTIPGTGWHPPTEFPNLSAAKRISFDTETKDLRLTDNGPGWARNDSHIVGFSIGAEAFNGERKAWYFPIRHEVDPHLNMDARNCLAFADYALNTLTDKIGVNLTYDYGTFKAEGVRVGGRLFDCSFAEALIDSDALVGLDAMANKYLNRGKETDAMYKWIREAYPNTPEKFLRREIYRTSPKLVGFYGEGDALQPLDIYAQQEHILWHEGLHNVFRLECDLIPLIVAMRFRGVRVDLDKAAQIRQELIIETAELYEKFAYQYERIHSTATQQIGPVLERIGIPMLKNNDTGNYIIRKEWLAGLDHPAAELINEIREHEKIVGTFFDSYIFGQHINGYLYPQFHQLKGDENGTMVGRFACVAAHTEIDTSNGPKRIDEINAGDKVKTHKGRFRRVLKTWVKGAEPMLSIKFSNGYILTCTISHRVLASSGEWLTVEKIADEYFKDMGVSAREYCARAGIISRSRTDDITGNSDYPANDLSQCIACRENEYAGTGEESFSSASLLVFENGRQQSNDGEDGFTTSQLDWRGWRPKRLLDNNAQWGTSICSQSENGTSIVASKATGILSRASYRWRSDEQRTRQSCAGNPSGAQNYSFTASSGQQIVTVEEINFAGCFLVYDITVEEDESYSACGIYSHNSSTPNLQNIPSRSKLGKKVRECFVPDVGHIKWRKFDFSQIHYRLLAHYAVDRGDGSAEALRERYRNDKTTDYHMDVYRNVAPLMGWSLTDEEEIKLKRRPIKNVNFGLLYGQSEKSLAYKSGMSEAQAKDFFKSYHAGAPYVKATMEEIGKEVQQYGYVTTLLGRRIRFNYWEPIRRDFDNPEMPLPYELAIRKWGAGIRRAYEYRGVNYKFQGSEPDIMKSAMRACWQSGVYDVTGVPSITVHDETDHSVIDDTPRMREAYDFIKHTMENTIKLRIPIFADENNGPNWGKSD